MNIKLILITVVCLLSGCATMDSSLSCNQTAFDSCMTIEQADALSAHDEDKHGSANTYKGASNSIDTKSLAGTRVVISPWVDADGQSHSGEVLNFSSKGA